MSTNIDSGTYRIIFFSERRCGVAQQQAAAMGAEVVGAARDQYGEISGFEVAGVRPF
jgi:hypothetical protein